MFIIAIPEGTTFDAMPEALQKTIAKYKGVFADGRLVDTGVYEGKELRLINADIDATTLNAVTNNDLFDDEGDIIGTEPVSDLTGKIQTWAGKSWVY